MMNNIMKCLSSVFVICAAIACLVMVAFEVLYMHVPSSAFLVFWLLMFGYVVTNHIQKRAK